MNQQRKVTGSIFSRRDRNNGYSVQIRVDGKIVRTVSGIKQKRNAEALKRKLVEQYEDIEFRGDTLRKVEVSTESIGQHVEAFLVEMEAGAFSRRRGRPTDKHLAQTRTRLTREPLFGPCVSTASMICCLWSKQSAA